MPSLGLGLKTKSFYLLLETSSKCECVCQYMYREGPEGVKWELGLAGFALGKWGSNHTETGIWSVGMKKTVKN